MCQQGPAPGTHWLFSLKATNCCHLPWGSPTWSLQPALGQSWRPLWGWETADRWPDKQPEDLVWQGQQLWWQTADCFSDKHADNQRPGGELRNTGVQGALSQDTFGLVTNWLGIFRPKLVSLNWPHWADSVIESPCPSVCVSVCLWPFKTPSSRDCGDFWSNRVLLILPCNDTIFFSADFGRIFLGAYQNILTKKNYWGS